MTVDPWNAYQMVHFTNHRLPPSEREDACLSAGEALAREDLDALRDEVMSDRPPRLDQGSGFATIDDWAAWEQR